MTLFLGGQEHGKRHPKPRAMLMHFVKVVPDEDPMLMRVETEDYEFSRFRFPSAERDVVIYFPVGYSDATKEHLVANYLEGR